MVGGLKIEVFLKNKKIGVELGIKNGVEMLRTETVGNVKFLTVNVLAEWNPTTS